MDTALTTAFQNALLATWTEPDAEQRRRNIEATWAPDGRLAISSLGAPIEGTDEIAAHIARVHDDLITGKGLSFSYDQSVEAGDALLLRWSMRVPSGDIVGRGADIVFRDPTGRATVAYMFMGVN